MRILAVLAILALLVAPAAGEVSRPRVKSTASVVIDAKTGIEIWSKDADEVRAIASMTKIFVAMVVRKKGLALQGWSTISAEDVAASEGGSKTRLPEGQTFKNVDLLRAMLMVSDNRAPTALGRAVGLDTQQLIAEMNALAEDLGLKKTRFVDTTGITENVSTAREIALALRATLDDPVLAKILGTHKIRIVSKDRKLKVDYRSTVHPLHEGKRKIRGGKTGHSEAAGYCLMVAATVAGREYLFTFLGGARKKTRFADFGRVASWLESQRMARTASR
jgi:D-alanyl-D-alanine endopeptidase (penicillin-binding protein 7)